MKAIKMLEEYAKENGVALMGTLLISCGVPKKPGIPGDGIINQVQQIFVKNEHWK